MSTNACVLPKNGTERQFVTGKICVMIPSTQQQFSQKYDTNNPKGPFRTFSTGDSTATKCGAWFDWEFSTTKKQLKKCVLFHVKKHNYIIVWFQSFSLRFLFEKNRFPGDPQKHIGNSARFRDDIIITRYHSNRGVSSVSRCAADLEIAERL